MKTSKVHTTKVLLIDIVSKFLEEKNPDEITLEEVLKLADISKGSFYYHFENLQDLIETGQITRYKKWVNLSISFLKESLVGAQSTEELRFHLKIITSASNGLRWKNNRAERAFTLAACIQNPRLGQAIGKEIARLTRALVESIDELKEKGLMKSEIDSRSMAIFIQSYHLGKIVNDFCVDGITDQLWDDFVINIIDNTFISAVSN